jgi:hypothetical protein
MSDIFGAVGSVASAAISADAVKSATKMQVDALQRQKDFVFQQLNPEAIGGAATSADVQRAQQRLALQGQIDPALLAQRYASEGAIGKTAADIAGGQTPADQVAAVAAQEAVAGTPGMQEAKKGLIDAALKELSAGATLPPDVQNELVRTGLEKSGMVTGAASGKGFGGQILRTILGTAGINLQAQRQQRAAALTTAAQDLETKRQAILGTLFPNLQNVQLKGLQAQQGVLQQSNQMVPEAGLGGTDIANLWLARVGATNQLAQSAADAASRGGMAQAQIWNQGLGNAVGYGSQALPSTASTYNWLFNSPSAGASVGTGAGQTDASSGWLDSFA